jgi:SAM-dependent methyltransferase
MSAPLEGDPVKARMKAAWMAGDYGVVAQCAEPGALEIFAGWKIAPGSRMLDVACGTGHLAIAAARSGVNVVGIDLATNLLEQARARAAKEGLAIHFDEGDAEQLPYPDASFDTIVSMLGAMYAPHPDRVAAELIRVCRSGGRIIMVNWTPTGCMGQMIRLHGKFAPPQPGVPPFTLWGDEATVRERLRDGIAALAMVRRIYPSLGYPSSVPEFVELWLEYLGPSKLLFAALDGEKQTAFRHELEELFSAYNRATDGTTLLEAEYLEVIATRG